MKQLLFSITKKDFEIQNFRSGGAGGQNQNKVNSGVRIIHKASGAVAESRDSRNQLQNKKSAFLKLVNSDKFKKWHKLETMRRLGQLAVAEENVKQMMSPKNLRVEVKSDKGRWVEAKEDEVLAE
jgi:protein subunit release factor B